MYLKNVFYNIKKRNAIKNLYEEYPVYLIDYFDPVKLYNVPNYDLDNNSDYIDYINSSDFGQNHIIRGFDTYDRPYISFKYIFNHDEYITTIFQRYTDDSNYWVIGGDLLPGLTGNLITDGKLIVLSDLLNYKYSEYSCSDNNYQIYLPYLVF